MFRSIAKRHFIYLGLFFCGLLAVPTAKAQERLLDYQRQVTPDGVGRGRAVVVDAAAVADDPSALWIELPDGTTRLAVRDGAERRGPEDIAWRGRFAGRGRSRVVLTLLGEMVVGRFSDDEQVVLLEPTAAGHRIREVDAFQFAPEGEPLPARTPAKFPHLTTSSVDPVDGIDIMVLYSSQVTAAIGDPPAVAAHIQSAIDVTNTAFIDSDMDARFVLVHHEETTRNEVGGDLTADLQWLASNAGVAALRDQYRADMVGLLVSSGDYCGRAYLMNNPSPTFEDSAFQVTHFGCAVGNLTFAHEHGHNMGFEHDPANGGNPANASYPWSFGHFVDGSYRTVMSYSSECTLGCTRVAHFSNPGIDHAGAATGINNTRDNARSGDLTAPIVTDFRLRAAVPDLVVTGAGVTDTTPTTIETFTTNATVQNQGAGMSDASTLRYYRSDDSVITTSDTEMSTDAVSSLAAGGNEALSDDHSIATAGTYWVGACVDSVAGESDTANNCSSGVQVVVSEPACSLTLSGSTVTGAETFNGCTITAGPSWDVSPTGAATLTASQWIAFGNGVSVQAGGTLTVELVP